MIFRGQVELLSERVRDVGDDPSHLAVAEQLEHRKHQRLVVRDRHRREYGTGRDVGGVLGALL